MLSKCCVISFVLFAIGVRIEAAELCTENEDVIQRINDTVDICINSSSLNGLEKVFPKCCPLNYAYDKNNRFCVRSEQQNRFNNHTFFKIGLRNCINKRITNRYISSNVEIRHKSNIYCVDEVYQYDEIVVRECENGDIEKDCGVGSDNKCLRKCCPDQEIYVKALCSATVNFSINYTKLKKVYVLKGTDCLSF